MALWQIDFFIIPWEDDGNVPAFEKDEDGLFDDFLHWQKKNADTTFFNTLEKIMGRGKSWSKDLVLLGNEVSNRIDIYYKQGRVDTVSMRIDFRSNYEHIVRAIIDFCVLNGLMILNNDLGIMLLNFETFKNEIENSPQVIKYSRLAGTESK